MENDEDDAGLSYLKVATCTKAIGDHGGSTGATHRCLGIPRRADPKLGLHTGVQVCPGVWIPNRGYIQAFGSPTAATYRCLDSQPRRHTSVWIPSWGYTRVFGVPNGRLCKLPLPRT